MSSGEFNIEGYSTDAGDIHPITVQPETLLLTIGGVANSSPEGEITGVGSVNVSGGRRRNGINARKVRVTWTGAPPAGYQVGGTITLPWLDPASFVDLQRGQEGTYLSTAVTLVGKTPENIR